MLKHAIIIDNVVKTYKSGKIIALNNISLKIPKGIIYGIIGKNGAGKSTLIKCITGLIKPDSGSLKIYGKNAGEIKNLMGYIPEVCTIYDFMTGMDFLETIADLRGISHKEMNCKLHEMKQYIDFPDMNLLASSYSKGNFEKLIFLSAFLHNPDVAILDEPFTGFDPAATLKAKEYIKNYTQSGKTVILSTHILELAAQICNNVAIINKGTLLIEHKFNQFESLEAKLNILKEVFE